MEVDGKVEVPIAADKTSYLPKSAGLTGIPIKAEDAPEDGTLAS